MTEALVLTLASDLEHAATALDVVDDEARQHIASLLSPKARQLLAALTAADHAPPPPTAVTAPPIAVAPPSASALPPTSDPADERPIARPRPASGLQAFPEDVLGAIVSFVDLPMRFTCVVACGAMRDAAARLSPRLEHALVLRRYPMLATIGSSPTAAPRFLRPRGPTRPRNRRAGSRGPRFLRRSSACVYWPFRDPGARPRLAPALEGELVRAGGRAALLRFHLQKRMLVH